MVHKMTDIDARANWRVLTRLRRRTTRARATGGIRKR